MIVLPIAVIAERAVVAHLRRYDAVSPDKPMGYAPGRLTHARALRRLRDRDVVKGEGQALWLDEAAWGARSRSRRKRALTLAVVAVVGAGIAGLAGLRG